MAVIDDRVGEYREPTQIGQGDLGQEEQRLSDLQDKLREELGLESGESINPAVLDKAIGELESKGKINEVERRALIQENYSPDQQSIINASIQARQRRQKREQQEYQTYVDIESDADITDAQASVSPFLAEARRIARIERDRALGTGQISDPSQWNQYNPSLQQIYGSSQGPIDTRYWDYLGAIRSAQQTGATLSQADYQLIARGFGFEFSPTDLEQAGNWNTAGLLPNNPYTTEWISNRRPFVPSIDMSEDTYGEFVLDQEGNIIPSGYVGTWGPNLVEGQPVTVTGTQPTRETGTGGTNYYQDNYGGGSSTDNAYSTWTTPNQGTAYTSFTPPSQSTNVSGNVYQPTGGNMANGGFDLGFPGISSASLRESPWANVGTNWEGSPVFGEFTPQQQYASIMSTALPRYYMPGYSTMAQRQFNPTFGRFLLGGYGNDTQGLGTNMAFAPWFTGVGQGMSAVRGEALPLSNIGTGWDLARKFSQEMPGSSEWNRLSSRSPGMAYAMQDPEAVRAMAMARYYGGGAPVGGYAGRAVEQTMRNIYDRYMQAGIQKGQTSPAGYLSYLEQLAPSRFGAFV
jgi:hypothetical protein